MTALQVADAAKVDAVDASGAVTAESPASGPRRDAGRITGPALGVVVLASLVGLAFADGGFYAGVTGLAAAVAALGLLARVALVRRPFAGVGWPLAAAGLVFAALAALTLASAIWSDALALAIVEFDRTLLYLLVLLGVGSLGRTPRRIQWLLYGLAAAAVVVCVAGLVSRLAPDVLAVEPGPFFQGRLSYPIGYWNAVGLLAALGLVVCAHLSASERERWPIRVVGAVALPVLATALVLTYSRAGLGLAVVGLVLYAVVARPRGLLGALIAGVPTVGLAVHEALAAELLSTENPTSAAATAQGHDLAMVVAGCVVGAVVLRAATLPLDGLLTRFMRLPGRRRAGRVLGVLAVVGVLFAGVAVGVPGAVADRARDFLDDAQVERTGAPLRERLTESGGKTRILLWNHSIDQFERHPVRGTGAGTFRRTWIQARPKPSARQVDLSVVDGHSLYLETLGEFGVPGLVLLLAGLGILLGRFLWLCTGPDRALGAVLLAAGVTWAGHAAFDWDWEVPGVTVWLFAAGGLALARPLGGASSKALRWPFRLGAVTVLGALAVLPAQMAVSQLYLDRSAAALRDQDCESASVSARRATATLGLRPEPLQIAAVCQIRAGRGEAAVRLASRARDQDPGDWTLHYTESLIRASAGVDPRPALRRAERLNPNDPFIIDAVRGLRTNSRAAWLRRGPRLPLVDG